MAISLSKGEKISLTKQAPGLNTILVGLGWDTNRYDGEADFDLDASVFVVKENGKVGADRDFVFYGNLEHPSKCVMHTGDNRTGAGDGDDEQIFVDLGALPNEYDRIIFVVTIYQAQERKQHFGLIENAFIRICDASNDTEFCKFNLSENYENKTAMIVGEMIKDGGEWKFNALGQPTTDDGILEISKRFS